MPKDLQPSESRAWSAYWQTGATSSCPGSYAEGYGGEFATFWRRALAAAPNPTVALDLATGSGAVAALLAGRAAATGETLRVTGVDLAAIDPAPHEGAGAQRFAGAQVDFIFGVDCAALPFPPDSFNLVVSHYGIEYSDLSVALIEAVRVLRRNGVLAFVMHHAAAHPVAVARAELQAIEALNDRIDLFAALSALAKLWPGSPGQEGRSGSAAAHAARLRFNEVMVETAAMSERLPLAAALIADYRGFAIGQVELLKRGAHAAAVSATIREAQQGLAQHRQRLTEMTTAALDATTFEARVVAPLAKLGFTVETSPLAEEGRLMGWSLLATRN